MNKRFHSLLVLWMLGVAILLAGCGRELQQRQAFTIFLQKEVIPRNSSIIVPTKAMRKKFGEYAKHYDVIVDYNKAVTEKVRRPLDKLQGNFSDAMKPEAGVKERRDATVKYLEALKQFEQALDQELAVAEGKISVLKQPDEVDQVFMQAVEKHVRVPAKTLKAMIPATKEMLEKNLEMLDFILAHKSKVEIRDGMIQVRDRSTLAQLSQMQADIAKKAQDLQKRYKELTSQGESAQ